MKSNGSIIASEIIQEWHRERYYKDLADRKKKKAEEEKNKKVEQNTIK